MQVAGRWAGAVKIAATDQRVDGLNNGEAGKLVACD